MSVFDDLITDVSKKGAAYVVLIDPDRNDEDSIQDRVQKANISGVDALFVGGSLMMDSKCVDRVRLIKSYSNIPVIFFPGGVGQLNPYYDAMLFMSVISGRNPHYLIGEQVISAPLVKDMDIETIPTGYLLIDGGAGSTVEFMSGTRPIPMDRVDVTVAHALAGQYLGMKLIYLEAGSGAKYPVSSSLIGAVNDMIDVPLVVGGGIKTPEVAAELVQSGASIIVTGTVIEDEVSRMKEFSNAIHWKE
ncbi:MAG: geranylgeranylglyceryl/heptaprenylglyceryl phosphate synthase [bacterium TMED46]|nr:MAG: geranylgeranylglyceryl/heptaprenylglyceryl phosphate synthase [bacterium TMED46]|tara:strand:- start:340 stop:1080 length:741 start_codon:yes stop_codon:yes gene_type:complete